MPRIILTIGVCCAFFGLTACADETGGKTYTVSPGMSIQKIIAKASSGDTVQVLPGEYSESITLDKEGITLKGLAYEGDRATLSAKLAEEEEPLETAIRISADNVTVEGFVIQGFTTQGVNARDCSNVTLRGLILLGVGPRLEDVEQAGIVAQSIQGLTVDRVVVDNWGMTGLAAERSTNVAIVDTELFRSHVGLVLSNCEQSRVENCSIHDNGLGIVVMATPDADEQFGGYCKITYTRVTGNRAAWTDGAPFTNDVSQGVGILIAGADHTEIKNCLIEDNESGGIVTNSSIKNEDYSAAVPADHTYVHHNRYARNGLQPSEGFSKRFTKEAAGDLYWDGKGERNQWQEDEGLKTFPENLVVEHGGVHTDVIHFL